MKQKAKAKHYWSKRQVNSTFITLNTLIVSNRIQNSTIKSKIYTYFNALENVKALKNISYQNWHEKRILYFEKQICIWVAFSGVVRKQKASCWVIDTEQTQVQRTERQTTGHRIKIRRTMKQTNYNTYIVTYHTCLLSYYKLQDSPHTYFRSLISYTVDSTWQASSLQQL